MRRCVFLDRDGVINVKAAAGDYIRSWEQFKILPAVVDWIRLFNALDLLVIVVTNQRGVAKGLMTAADLDEIHQRMCSALAERGARVDDVFSCIHAEGACDCRKPRAGLVVAAARKWDVDLSHSILIGDSNSDRELADACGMRFIGVHGGTIQRVLG
jgi:histidinol-phosphate phosphatase family protein